MADEREHILEVLQLLESRLNSSNRSIEAARIRLILGALATSRSLDAALESLYSVRGFDRFALRLMWYAEKCRDMFAPAPTPRAVARRVDELLSLLPPDPGGSVASTREKPRTVAVAVDEFGVAMESLKRAVFHGGQISALTEDMAARLASSADSLGRAAEIAESRDVAQFAQAVGKFLDRIRTRALPQDVRAVNLLDSANLTLQTAVQTHAADDYDSLQEIVRLLEDPLPLFEQQQPPPGRA